MLFRVLTRIDNNPKIITLGLKNCLFILLEEEYSHPTLLYLCTESLLNEENKRIIENINFIRRNRYRVVPPLYVDDGNRLTSPEKELIDRGVNNKNCCSNIYTAERHTSRSNYYCVCTHLINFIFYIALAVSRSCFASYKNNYVLH